MRRGVAAAAVAVALAVTAPGIASAQQGCPPGTYGVVIHYEDPRGWITIHLPLCFNPR